MAPSPMINRVYYTIYHLIKRHGTFAARTRTVEILIAFARRDLYVWTLPVESIAVIKYAYLRSALAVT